MKSTRPRHLPNQLEDLLIKAACFESAEALQSWQAFIASGEPMTATASVTLPAIYANLHDYEPATRAVEPLKAAHQNTWVRNRLKFHHGAAAAGLLAGHGIETVLLKGASIVAGQYREAATRPMSDVDLLVPIDQSERARQLLVEDGWRPVSPPAGDARHVLEVAHATGMVRDGGGSIDVHWHVLFDCCNPGDDDDFWAAAQPVRLLDVDTKTLCPSDLLLHTLVHGSRFNSPRIIAWAMDSIAIIRKSGPDLDWQRLLAQTRRTGQVLPVLSCLEYLAGELRAAVPESVLGSLRGEKVSLLDRLSYRDQNLEDTTVALLRREVTSHLKRTRGRPIGERLRTAVWHLQASRGIKNPRHVPYQMLRRLYRRLTGQPPPRSETANP